MWVYFWTLFCTIDPYACFVPVPLCFGYFSFVILSEIWEGCASSFVLFLRIALAILNLLWFHIKFSIISSGSVKKESHGKFERDHIKSVNCFE